MTYILMTDGIRGYRNPTAPQEVKAAEAAGTQWGGYHFLAPEAPRPTVPNEEWLFSPVAGQAVWYLMMLHSCGVPQLPTACVVAMRSNIGWDRVAQATEEWVANVESATGERCVVAAAPDFAEHLKGWPFRRQEIPYPTLVPATPPPDQTPPAEP